MGEVSTIGLDIAKNPKAGQGAAPAAGDRETLRQALRLRSRGSHVPGQLKRVAKGSHRSRRWLQGQREAVTAAARGG